MQKLDPQHLISRGCLESYSLKQTLQILSLHCRVWYNRFQNLTVSTLGYAHQNKRNKTDCTCYQNRKKGIGAIALKINIGIATHRDEKH